ncbi:molybdopterin dinucleotide binding domain-containing protein [Methanohalophilus profundi]|uniref:molybdopterin dinucleotide binding domain-containing protein n=1 Tax=Methanohalophilus profundi TaxID=2138083 RepID=UPI002989CF73|nr:molybdopterin dinucleotide binding domain-containing protein [Methanohalophilus profundi]
MMGFDQFLSSPEMEILIITHRDIFQSAASSHSRFSDDYANLTAIIRLDKQDMKKAGLKEGNLVAVENSAGKVVVKALQSTYEEPHPGTAYMLNGPWVNALVSAETSGTGVPAFKYIEAKMTKSKESSITSFE